MNDEFVHFLFAVTGADDASTLQLGQRMHPPCTAGAQSFAVLPHEAPQNSSIFHDVNLKGRVID